MAEVFLKIVNMSISASYIVLAVLLLRLLLKKAPKWISILLWGIVGFRLICPFSIEAAFSLMPSAQTVSPEIMTDMTPQINTGVPVVNQVINPVIGQSFAPTPAASASPLQVWIPVLGVLWIGGMAAFLIYTVISYAGIRRKVATAVLLQENIYQSENVASPFVLGIVRPKIYLPYQMERQNMAYVLAHERAHIQRRDHLWKPLGFALLALHWFNPLMWLGYALLCRDIELACDEKVIGRLDRDARADYSQALLACSVNRGRITACPLAFGEVGVKERVKTVLNYKKPGFWIIVTAVIACVAVAVCFLTDPKSNAPAELEAQVSLTEKYPAYFGLDASQGLDVYVWQMSPEKYDFALLGRNSYDPDTVSDELMKMRGATAAEMGQILASYGVSERDIQIIPWKNPRSRYLGEIWVATDFELAAEEYANYMQYLKDMLFAEPGQQSSGYPVYDTMVFDIDGDGMDEECTLRDGRGSGLITFTLEAKLDQFYDYANVYFLPLQNLSFVKGNDGVVCIQGFELTGKRCLYEITATDDSLGLLLRQK